MLEVGDRSLLMGEAGHPPSTEMGGSNRSSPRRTGTVRGHARSRSQLTALRLMIAVAGMSAGAPELLACSGPRALRTILDSILIGWLMLGISVAIAFAACKVLLRRSSCRRIVWVVVPLALHPGWWMSATHGDCGYALRFWSFLATLWIASVASLAICWPRPVEVDSKKWRWVTSGALAGAIAGLPISSVALEGGSAMSAITFALAGASLCGTVIAGTLIGADLLRLRTRDRRRFRVSLRTLVLLPVLLTPVLVSLTSVEEFRSSVSATSPFTFVVVDDTTGRPIGNARLRVIDPRFALDDAENQPERAVTGPDGSTDYFLSATAYGWEGLLLRNETISYNPYLIRVEALEYEPFYTSLASDPPIPANLLTARPLGLTFPPPRSLTIRLKPAKQDPQALGKSPLGRAPGTDAGSSMKTR
jgi:hypothetical protein